MPQNKYSQLHQSLLFHWTQPKCEKELSAKKSEECKFIPKAAPKTKPERDKFIEHLSLILTTGLRFGIPKCNHVEQITPAIQTKHNILCFSEWNVGSSSEHARRYGHIGLGFTRKYIMSQNGRPVIYINHKQSDLIRKAMIKLLESSTKDGTLLDHAQVVASLLKIYKDPRKPRGSGGEIKARREGRTPDEDRTFALDFGTGHGNLEDREWRILDFNTQDVTPRILPCEPGKLAMIVMPDHKTLSLALQHDRIREMVLPEGKPAICMISREMLRSI
jgi:hypothetical protein